MPPSMLKPCFCIFPSFGLRFHSSLPPNGSWKETLDCFLLPGPSTNPTTYAYLLRISGNSKTLSDGKRLHAHMIKSGFERHPSLACSLIKMYCKCGAVEEALTLFSSLHEGNVYWWNLIIGAYTQLGENEQAVLLFQLLQQKGIIPDKVTFVHILSAFASKETLPEGRRMHGRLMGSGFESDIIVATALLSMYSRFGSLENARIIFDRITERNVVCWNAMIAAYVQHGCGNEAFQLFEKMQQRGPTPDKATFISVLSACAIQTALSDGKQVHLCITYCGLELDMVVATALVNMYAKCNSMDDAKRTFKKMDKHDVIAWNAIIASYAYHGHAVEALENFSQMQQQGFSPNMATFVSVLDAHIGHADLAEGMKMHACIVHRGFREDAVLGTALVSMYGRCNSLEDAQNVFERLRQRNVISWNAMITVCACCGEGKKALQLYDEMQQEGLVPDKLTFIGILDACASRIALREGRYIHLHITNDELDSDVRVVNALLNLYGKCGKLDDAQKTFQYMPVRNVVSWNALIAAYSEHGHASEALQLIDQMQLEALTPNELTFLSILSACAHKSGLQEGKHVHILTIKTGLDSDVPTINALINMYGKCSRLEDARTMFERLPERNIFSWNAMLAANSQYGYSTEIYVMFDQMRWQGVLPDKFSFAILLSTCASPAALAEGKYLHTQIVHSGFGLDNIIMTALVNMYGRCGCLGDAQTIFNKMTKHDTISWNTIISVHALGGRCKDAHALFYRMHLEGAIADKVTFLIMLSIYADQSALSEGKYVHVQVTHSGVESDVAVATALVNMYGKCGSMQDAQIMFDSMSNRNVFTWNTMIAVYAQHGHGKETLHILDEMQREGLIPDEITFVGVLSACSHTGLVDEGYQCLVAINQDHDITIAAKHYDCIIDLLSRAGQLDEADGLINYMPFQPTTVSWTSFLGACKNQGDMDRGEQVLEHMLELDPNEVITYVMLSKIYTASDKVLDAKICYE